MESLASPNTATVESAICVHCGALVPAHRKSSFCCAGCEAVYALLQTKGLGRYYEIRQRTGSKGWGHAPASGDESFAYLDDPEFIGAYADSDSRRMRFYLEGVHCAACVWLTEKIPAWVEGADSVRLDLSSGVATVTVRPQGSFARVASELAKLGYRPHPVKVEEMDPVREREARKHLLQLGVAGACAGNIMLLAVALYGGADGVMGKAFQWLSLVLYLPVLFYSAQPFFRSAWSSVRARRVSIDVPIALGISIGTAASVGNLIAGSDHIYFDSLSGLLFLLLSSRYLLRRVQAKALDATHLIHFLTPSRSRKKEADGTVHEVKTDSLRAGDLVEVLPGEVVPVDGVVTQGRSGLNRAWLTGESASIGVAAGDLVQAGVQNLTAPLEVRVLSSGSATRLGAILKQMEQSLTQRAQVVDLADRVGQAFVTATLILVVVGFLVGNAVSFQEGLSRALAVAIVVCPCALALAIPLSVSLAMGKLARSGILIKGADVLERLSQVRKIYLDKTGTLTVGKLKVTQWLALEAGLEPMMLAMEKNSNHPVACAIREYLEDRLSGMALPRVEDFEEVVGWGVRGRIHGKVIALNRLPRFEIRSELNAVPGSRVGVYVDGKLSGVLVLRDELRVDSAEAIRELRALGFELEILSGDHPVPVRALAEKLGIAQGAARAELTPEAKAGIVKADARSLMVGDGANDAVALASAWVGVAVQSGMEVSLRAAGVYSTQPGIKPLVRLLVVARETMKVIRRSLAFTLLYNVVVISIAMSGALNPLVAAVLMPISAFTVFAISMAGTRRLRAVLREGRG